MTTLAEEMKAHALEAQRFSRKYLVLELDFSEASVSELDNQSDSIGFAIRGGKSAENVDLLTRLWGAYLGEALRKATGAEWVLDAAAQVQRIGLRGQDATVHPHEQVRRRLNGTHDDSLLQFYQRARAQLKSETN